MWQRPLLILVLTYAALGQTQIDNVTTTDTFLNLKATTAPVCVDTYVFDLNSNLVACCSSLIGPSQDFYLSARNDLINNTLTPSVPTSILVKVSASTPSNNTCNPA